MKTYSRANKIPLYIVGGLFFGALLLVMSAFRVPSTKEVTDVQTTYKLKGEFSHVAWGRDPSQKVEVPKASHLYNLVEAIDVNYSYRFLPAGPAGEDTEEVEISALIESPGRWEKEVVLVPAAQYTGGAQLTFSFKPEELQALAAQISKELGVGNPSPHITLKAKVNLQVPLEGGLLEDQFTQSLQVSTVGAILEWTGPLEVSRKGFYKGLAYDQKGAFGYALHLKPSLALGQVEKTQEGFKPAGVTPQEEKKKPEPVYFTKIVESIEVSYDFRLLAEGLDPQGEGEIAAVLETPAGPKEVPLVPRAPYQGGFVARFPLDLDPLQKVMAAIVTELGVGGPLPQVTLKATVHTQVETPKGPREADFVQSTVLKLGTNTLTWQGGLTRSEKGEWEGTRYEQQGRFDYSIVLKDNLLFGPLTLRPEETPVTSESAPTPRQVLLSQVPPQDVPKQVAAKEAYDRDGLGRLEVTFSFPFEAEPAANNVAQELEVTGELAGTDWKESLTLVPKTSFAKEFASTFPLDVAFLYAVIQGNQRGLKEPTGAATVAITASVHTRAETAFGPIEEKLSYPLEIKLGPTQVSFPKTSPQVKDGNIHKTVIRSNSSASAARTGSLGLMGLIGVALAFVSMHYWEARRNKATELEMEALQLKRKYKDLVLDVQALPEAKDGAVVELSSLEALVKSAEALLKPILHTAEPTRHMYLVMDGVTQYRYLHDMDSSLPPTSVGPPTPEGQRNSESS